MEFEPNYVEGSKVRIGFALNIVNSWFSEALLKYSIFYCAYLHFCWRMHGIWQ